jgi:hypothetical protein
MAIGNIISDLKGLVSTFTNIFGGASDKNYPTTNVEKITNQPKYSNKDWRLSRGYAFQVVEVDDRGGVIGNGDTKTNDAIDWKEHRLQINPQELTQDEVFAITVTPTLRGVIVEHHGVTLKDITISGTTGVSPLRREGGADARSGSPVLQSGHSGYEEFHELRSYFRVYAEAKRLGSQTGHQLRMQFKNFKDNEFLFVEPMKFSMKRSASKAFLYDYVIQLKAIGVATFAPKTSGGLLGALESIDDTIDTVQGYMQLGQQVISGGIGIIRRFDSDVKNTILNPLRAISAALIALKGGRAVLSDFGISRKFISDFNNEVKRIENNFNDAIGRNMTAFNAASGRTPTLSGTTRPSTYQELQILNGLGAIKKGNALLLAQDEKLFNEDVSAGNKRVTDIYSDKITIDTPNSVREKSIDGNDTIHTIATRELGNPDRFRDLVLLNNLKPPYIDAAGGPGVLKPGQKILIPQNKSNSEGGVVKNKEYNITTGMSSGEKALGVDIRVTDEGDLAISNIKDLDLVGGMDNMSQAVALKLYYEKGSLKRHPEVGTNLQIGRKVKSNNAKEAQEDIIRSFLSDSRIDALPYIDVSQEGSTTNINMLVKLRNLEQPVPIPLKLNNG